MTRAELQEALPANSVSYFRTKTIGEAIEAGDERPGMDLIRARQEKWKRFWSRRGTNPIEANPELAD